MQAVRLANKEQYQHQTSKTSEKNETPQENKHGQLPPTSTLLTARLRSSTRSLAERSLFSWQRQSDRRGKEEGGMQRETERDRGEEGLELLLLLLVLESQCPWQSVGGEANRPPHNDRLSLPNKSIRTVSCRVVGMH
uniref:Uncharacterized protein n=1 Tax=Physcomitrium patens TaxID=3218 RepID=A0A2K1JQV5_PHYPA|nr:hypothetical protein PHYPA_016295 [Physcomitrium patens]